MDNIQFCQVKIVLSITFQKTPMNPNISGEGLHKKRETKTKTLYRKLKIEQRGSHVVSPERLHKHFLFHLPATSLATVK